MSDKRLAISRNELVRLAFDRAKDAERDYAQARALRLTQSEFAVYLAKGDS